MLIYISSLIYIQQKNTYPIIHPQIYFYIIFKMFTKNKYMISYLLLLTIYIRVQCKLQVTNFAQMDSSLEDQSLKDIPYSIANFGFAPFGKAMVANLVSTPGLDKQCGFNSTEKYSKQIQNSFLLIPRGDCPFVTKALHAQEMGAKMAIIMDNEDTEHTKNIIMKDNGYGYKVTIPSIFINYKMGQKLLKLLNQTISHITMKILFENIKSQKANVTLYMQPLNRLSSYFIQQFKPFYLKVKNFINFQLVYDVINCSGKCSSDDCYFNGAYCSVSYQHSNSATGQLVLDQSLREQIMFEKNRQQWWSYMLCIDIQCNKVSQVKQCSDTCLTKIQSTLKPADLQAALKNSFDYSKDNKILKKNLQLLKTSGIQQYPTVSINSVKLKGSLNAQFVFDDICNTLINPPKQCKSYITQKQYNVQYTNTYWATIVIVLIACIILFSFLFIFCRRQMRKRMANQMQGRVDDMVSKYIEFYSQRNNRR